MIIWNGTKWVRFGGPVNHTIHQPGTTEALRYAHLDEWKHRRKEWLNVKLPSITEMPNLDDRLPFIRKQAEKYEAMNSYFNNHVSKNFTLWK